MIPFIHEYRKNYQDALIQKHIVHGVHISDEAITSWDNIIATELPNSSWEVFCKHYNPKEMPWPTPHECVQLSQNKYAYLWLKPILTKMFKQQDIHDEWMLQASLLPFDTLMQLNLNLRLIDIPEARQRRNVFTILECTLPKHINLSHCIHPQSPLWSHMAFVLPLAEDWISGLESLEMLNEVKEHPTVLEALTTAVHKNKENIDVMTSFYEYIIQNPEIVSVMFPIIDHNIMNVRNQDPINYISSFEYMYVMLLTLPHYFHEHTKMDNKELFLTAVFYSLGHEILVKDDELNTSEIRQLKEGLHALENLFDRAQKPITGKIETLKLLYDEKYCNHILDEIVNIIKDNTPLLEEEIFIN